MDKSCGRKNKLKTVIDLLKKNLEIEIANRDFLLGIHLSKFKGYNSSKDIYTFKSEFEKLISPRVQAELLPEYLKKMISMIKPCN